MSNAGDHANKIRAALKDTEGYILSILFVRKTNNGIIRHKLSGMVVKVLKNSIKIKINDELTHEIGYRNIKGFIHKNLKLNKNIMTKYFKTTGNFNVLLGTEHPKMIKEKDAKDINSISTSKNRMTKRCG